MNIVPDPTGPEGPPPDQRIVGELVHDLAVVTDHINGVVSELQKIIGALVLVDDPNGVTLVVTQTREWDRFRVELEELQERLDPTGTLA